MGYRSEVALCLNRNGRFQFDDSLEKADSRTQDLVKQLMSAPKLHYKDLKTGCAIWYWDWIKWYPDYEEVRFIDDLMASLEPDDYLFCRIGDDSDDTEIRGSFHDNPFGMYLNRSITFNAA